MNAKLSIGLWATLIFFTRSAAHAQFFEGKTDDSLIAPLRSTPSFLSTPSSQLEIDRLESVLSTDGLTHFSLQRKSTPGRGSTNEPISGLVFKTSLGQTVELDSQGSFSIDGCASGQTFSIESSLKTDRFSVTDDSGTTYRIKANLVCGQSHQGWIDTETPSGQALGIWQVAHQAQQKIGAQLGFNFWSSRIRFAWPSDGDYYSWGTVHLTQGHAWDVVAHEMGHAIFDLAKIGVMEGGQHKIDECYNPTLALSEGWASYYAAWVMVDLNDRDAKFEFMVPRRSPIRFETIPSDVCASQSNEWRVTGFFWDLIDLNEDGESSQESFKKIFEALRNRKVRSTQEAVSQLKKAGLDATTLDALWSLNFLGSL